MLLQVVPQSTCRREIEDLLRIESALWTAASRTLTLLATDAHTVTHAQIALIAGGGKNVVLAVFTIAAFRPVFRPAIPITWVLIGIVADSTERFPAVSFPFSG